MASPTMMRRLVGARPGKSASRSPPWSLAVLHWGRGVAQSYLKKVAEGEQRWAERASNIKNGEVQHVWDVLEERGFIKDVAGDTDNIKKTILVKRIGAYVGVDPTADSLHLGHLLPMMALFWLWFNGHPAVTLIGGATGRIGDPTGRLQSRPIVSNAIIAKNITKIHYQLSRLWANLQELGRKYEFEADWAAKRHLLNNSMWLTRLSMYDFTKILCRRTRVGPLLSRDTIKQRMENGEGLSISELLYPLMQGWDFWHMYQKLGIQMQIGGSDQFGNIVAGIDAVKIIRDNDETPSIKMPDKWHDQPCGFTVPLVTDSAGAKIGKSDGNSLWLDEFKTSPYDLYGHFMRHADSEVERLLKLFTFIPLPKIDEIMAEHRQDPSARVAQHNLAFEVLSLVHGSQRALEEAQQHQFRFGGKLPHIVKVPSSASGIITHNNAPRKDIELPRSVLELSPARLLYAAGLSKSATEGQELVRKQGAYVASQPGQSVGLMPGTLNWTPIKMWFPEETSKFVLDDHMLILRRAKHNVRIIELISEEDWKESGNSYPGEKFKGEVRLLKKSLQKEAAERGDPPLKSGDFRRKMREQVKLRVANNPNIELPSKQEVRHAEWQKGQVRPNAADLEKMQSSSKGEPDTQ